MISLDKKFIFMHVPKTGGTSVENSILSDYAHYFEEEVEGKQNWFLHNNRKDLLELKADNIEDGKIVERGRLIGKHFSMHEYYMAFTNSNDFDKYFTAHDLADFNQNPLNSFYKLMHFFHRFLLNAQPFNLILTLFPEEIKKSRLFSFSITIIAPVFFLDIE